MAAQEEQFRRLALHDEELIESVLAMRLKADGGRGLDPRTQALVRLGAPLALGAAPVSYHWTVAAALDAGATPRRSSAADPGRPRETVTVVGGLRPEQADLLDPLDGLAA
jgi:hypothetical protein